jgi:GTPase SAR1 family protein
MFSIQVALLGHVSVGKTTILNALFQDKYSEVSMSRTTAAVNRFYLSTASHQHQEEPTTDGARENHEHTTATTMMDIDDRVESRPTSSTVPTLPPTTATRSEAASSILEQITLANKRLRVLSNNTLEELRFRVTLPEPLCEMRNDTQLVLIDIPGLNEQGSREKYQTYVRHRWKTWDCVIVVMDAVHGVNSEEQVQLLETVHHLYDSVKKIPIIILCNKLDDPEDEERMAIVREVQNKVESIFDVNCRQHALEELLLLFQSGDDDTKDDDKDETNSQRSLYPVFLPIAAAKAFLYRAASRLSLEQFQQQEQQRFNIDSLVRDEVGRFQFNKMSPRERYEVAYKVLSDPTQYQERLASTNFDKFLTVLARSVGGEQVQRRLIHQQLVVTLNDITLEDFLDQKVQAIADQHQAIGGTIGSSTGPLVRARFWKLFDAFLEKAFQRYRTDMDVLGLSRAVDLLCNYSKLSDTLTPVRAEEAIDIFQALKRVFKFQCQIIEEKAKVWNVAQAAFMNRWIKVGTTWTHHGTVLTFPVKNKAKGTAPDSPFHWERVDKGWKNKYSKAVIDGPNNPGRAKVTWHNLSPQDWNTILGSVLLASYSFPFVEHFGREKVRLEFLNKYGSFATYYSSSYCVNCIPELEKKARNDLALYTTCEIDIVRGVTPSHPTGYSLVYQVAQPNSLKDPAHWGHVGWSICHFAESSSISMATNNTDADERDSLILQADTGFSEEIDVVEEGESLVEGDY